MAKITNKKMYRDLMRMDGARLRDLNPMSRAHYAAAVAEPIVKTGAKVVGVVVGAAAIGMGVTACPTNTPDQDPTCQEACTESQDNHLGRNDNGTLAACDHDGKTIQGTCECTEQTAALDGIKITKAIGITVTQMNVAVGKFQEAYNDYLTTGYKNNFKDGRITEIRVVSGSATNKVGTILQVGYNATVSDIGEFFELQAIASIQPQTKNTFLADKGNKGREWVAKNMKDYADSVADLRNIAYDRANGISI